MKNNSFQLQIIKLTLETLYVSIKCLSTNTCGPTVGCNFLERPNKTSRAIKKGQYSYISLNLAPLDNFALSMPRPPRDDPSTSQ